MLARSLQDSEIHLWKIPLDRPEPEIQELTQTLSPDEQERAYRYKFPIHQRRFIAARGMLRKILGQYLDKPPQQIQFHYQPNGKPFLDLNSDEIPLCFNLSHSEDLALLALGLNLQIGIDLEWMREVHSLLKIAQRYFSEAEFHKLNQLEGQQQIATFFSIWTAKEAYVKATGEGLSGLSTMELEWTEDGKPQISKIGDKINHDRTWSLYQFYPLEDSSTETPPNAIATVAFNAPIQQFFHYTA